MVFEILNSANFDAGLNDAINLVEDNNFNTTDDKITVLIQMNGNYVPQLDETGCLTGNQNACVNTYVYINESDFAIGNDIIAG